MTDLWLPDCRIKAASPRLMDNTARFTSPLSGTVRTASRPGDRWGVRLDYENLTAFDRSRIEMFIARMRGAANRVLWSPTDFPQRGSFPSQELFFNNTLIGTSSWTSSGGTLSGTDRRLRLTFNGAGTAAISQAVANLTPNMPHVARYFLVDGKGSPLGSGAISSYIEGTAVNANAVAFEGLVTLALTPDAAIGNQFPVYPAAGIGNIPPGQLAGNYVELVWSSLSRCALIDNGPNLLEWSDTLATPWAPTAATVTANATTAADGTVSAAGVADTTANTAHFVSQGSIPIPAIAEDMMICGEFKAGAQPFVWLQMTEATGGTSCSAFFNLSTGVVGSTNTGTNWMNARSVIRSLGNGWYYCALIARKTNPATVLTDYVGSAAANGTQAYAGTGAAAVYSRRVTCSQSSVPARQMQSVGAPVPAAAQSGSAYFIKGLPPSTAGLALPGDWVEIDLELKRVTNQLDSDAAGLGYLQFSPPIHTPAQDEDPVIFNVPHGRFILSSNQPGWKADPGPNAQPFGTLSLDLVESPT